MIHQDLVIARNEIEACGGVLLFNMDYGYIAGPVEDVFWVSTALADRLKARFNVELQPAKSEAYSKVW